MKRFWLGALLSLLTCLWGGCHSLGPSLPSCQVAEGAFFGRLRNWFGKTGERKPVEPVAPQDDEDEDAGDEDAEDEAAGDEEDSSSHYGIKLTTTSTTTTTTMTSTEREGVWEEEYDSMEIPYTPIPPLQGIGLLGGAIFISLVFNLGRLPLLMGGIGVAQYINSMVERMHARRAAAAALRRFEDRRELIRARRRRRWIQTFYSHKALQGHATNEGEPRDGEGNATPANSSTGGGDRGTAGSEAPSRGIRADAESKKTWNTDEKKGSLNASGIHAEGSDKLEDPPQTREVLKTRLRKPKERSTEAQMMKEKTPMKNSRNSTAAEENSARKARPE
ncbi:UNVERIFIED_CONTAM: hypothetical protein HHA_290700 [Hammondia hammondi]|eukprot:XP_008889205.1 hypothetical protein HHA_290700 [Hammondia hammondi]